MGSRIFSIILTFLIVSQSVQASFDIQMHIKSFEIRGEMWDGVSVIQPKLTAYSDAHGYSIGYGHFGVSSDTVITEERAEAFFKKDILEAEKRMRRFITAELTQCQFDALLSFFYNVGYQPHYTLHHLVNANPNDPAIAPKMREYRMSQGKNLQGLVKRRDFEANWYFQDGCFEAPSEQEPLIAEIPPVESNQQNGSFDFGEADNPLDVSGSLGCTQPSDQALPSTAVETKPRFYQTRAFWIAAISIGLFIILVMLLADDIAVFLNDFNLVFQA